MGAGKGDLVGQLLGARGKIRGHDFGEDPRGHHRELLGSRREERRERLEPGVHVPVEESDLLEVRRALGEPHRSCHGYRLHRSDGVLALAAGEESGSQGKRQPRRA